MAKKGKRMPKTHVPNAVTIGYWIDKKSGEHHGGVKEFNIWSSAPTLDELYKELKGLINAFLTGYDKLRETVGDDAVLFYDVDEESWAKVETTEKMDI